MSGRPSAEQVDRALRGIDKRETFIGLQPPRDGREYDCQCGRCGSTLSFETCEECGGDGYIDDAGFDADEFEEGYACTGCAGRAGRGAFPTCISTEEWCNANPMQGRDQIARHMPEWWPVAR